VDPQEVASKQFTIVLRGYAREEVAAFLAQLAAGLADREAAIAEREEALARCRQQLSAPRDDGDVDRAALLRRLGEEAAQALTAADVTATTVRSQAESAAEAVRRDLQAVAARLGDAHQLMGDLVDLVAEITEDSAPPLPPAEVRLPD
jgi:DivIVA domain-containing protein